MMASTSILDHKSTFGDALKASGFMGDKKYRLSPEKYLYMFETHIEQGPILEDAGNDIGVVDSGAGHDAQFAAYMLPTTMIFVQSKDGLSHCEPEYSSPEHCTEGATVMLNAVLKADAE